MRVLVFQHHEHEGPSSLGEALLADGGSFDTIRLDLGEPIPAFAGYDQLWIMGGAMDVWDVEEHPWLMDEKRAIRQWASERRESPMLGLCLGHQLIADTLGGTCGPQRPAEIGVVTITVNGEGKRDPLLDGAPETFPTVQWHGVRVAQLPEGAVTLASSDACRQQIVRYGEKVWGIQGHVEAVAETVPRWSCLPGYREWLETNQGQGAIERFVAHSNASMPDVLSVSSVIYRNLKRLG